MPGDCIWRYPVALEFIRKLHGGSQPILVQASDGERYVVKFRENCQGPNVPFNDAVGTELYRACGLPVPRWSPIMLTDGFIDGIRAVWPRIGGQAVRPADGLCFGSRYLGQPLLRAFELLPEFGHARIRNRVHFWLAWIVDQCAEQTDLRQAIFIEDTIGYLHAVFIDHGYLFCGPEGHGQCSACHGRYADERIYSESWSGQPSELLGLIGSLNRSGLWRRIEGIPKSWWSMPAICHISKCVERLQNLDYLRMVSAKVLKAHQEKVDIIRALRANSDFRPDRDEILCRGV
jgi:hypothetical protein